LGPVFVRGTLDFEQLAPESETGFGYWAGTGVIVRLGEHFNLGANVRYSSADVELYGHKFDFGGVQYGFLIGGGW
jgi:hypothetical protein